MDADGPVVVVAHSQSSALGPLVAAATPGLAPRVSLPSDGVASSRRRARRTHSGRASRFPLPRPDGTTAWDPEVALQVMYPRLPADRARALVEHLRPMAMPPGDYPLQEHPDVPTALVYAAEDEIFEPAFERFMAEELLGIEPIELQSGHFPMVEDPVAVAELLDRLAAPA